MTGMTTGRQKEELKMGNKKKKMKNLIYKCNIWYNLENRINNNRLKVYFCRE